jgi:hypothetical protein
MEVKFTRRQFGRLGFATALAAGFGIYFNKVVIGQTPGLTIIGVRRGPVTAQFPGNPLSPELDEADEANAGIVPSKGIIRALTVDSFNTANLQANQLTETGGILVQGEQITGVTITKEGNIAITTSIVNASSTSFSSATSARGVSVNISAKTDISSAQNRIIILDGQNATSVPVVGVAGQQSLEGISTSAKGETTAVVRDTNSKTTQIVSVDPTTGVTTPLQRLPQDFTVSNVVTDSKGNRFGIATNRAGETNLIVLASGKTFPLIVDGRALNNGTSSLIVTPDDQLIGLGKFRYDANNFLFTINQGNGATQRIGKTINASRIAAATANLNQKLAFLLGIEVLEAVS